MEFADSGHGPRLGATLVRPGIASTAAGPSICQGGIGSPEIESAPSPPIAIDLIRERSVAPRNVLAGIALWRLRAIILPLIGRWCSGSDGKAPACHSPPPRVPRLTVLGDMERDARFPGQPVVREVVAKDPEHVTAVAAADLRCHPI